MVEKKDMLSISEMSDNELAEFLKKNAVSLKLNECREVVKLLGRNPTLTELHIFNIQWSEHSSYKSSREWLKKLPTGGKNVILGPSEDSGILRLGKHDGKSYGIVISHESHNHPSQVVPYEGAATGVGGNIRDVCCMGAKVIASADPLRFGDAFGKHKNRTRYIANAVIDGIAGYGNPVGIPVIAGDVYMNESFDDNCLVNVVCLGLVEEDSIIHSYVPKDSDGYDVIVVGKATDNSGFGGAAFASLVLHEDDNEANKGAVQVPDPFLKNVLLRATYAVFEEVKKQKISVGFKDCGAGGIMCATSELGESGGMGMEIELDKVNVSMKLPGFIIACGETQERFVWTVPKSFTPALLKIYNGDFELDNVADGAKAVVIGEVTKEKQYVLRCNGKVVCDAPIDTITKGIKYERVLKAKKQRFSEPSLDEPDNYNHTLLDVLRLPQIASKEKAFKHYDTEVQGNTIIRPGEADAGVITPIEGSSFGVALSVDGNPRYARINPRLGAAHAVAESMRNVAAVGAMPIGLTDCLNYGNPEVAEQFWEFTEGVLGLKEAAENIFLKGSKEAVPFVSGNVSFYNESKGKAIDPSAIVACVGILEDYSKAITMKVKKAGSGLYLIGPRNDELGGSAYYQMRGELGARVPGLDYALERGMLYGIIDCINKRLLSSCHDISDGGMSVAVAEMLFNGRIGATLVLNDTARADMLLFSESPGFVFEASDEHMKKIEGIFKKCGVDVIKIGVTGGDSLIVQHNEDEIINSTVEELEKAWKEGFAEALK